MADAGKPMRNLPRVVALLSPLVIVLFSLSPVWAACHAIAPAPAGTGYGSSWANAKPWNSSTFPFTITPGDTYYIAGGNYTNTIGTVFASPNQNIVTTIKKATNTDHGQNCSPSLATGWNNATMGIPVAHWDLPSTSGGVVLRFNTGGFTFDGSTGDGTSATAGQYGFYFHYVGPVSGAYGGFVIYIGKGTADVSNITLNHWEMDGGNAYAIPYSGVNGTVPIFAIAGQSTNNRNFTLSYFYLHDVWFPTNFFNIDTLSVHHGWIARNRTGSAHSGGLYFKGNPNDHMKHAADNVDVHNVTFEDIEGTGGITAIWGQGNNWDIYNNVWFNTGQPISIASISRTAGVVTAVFKNAVPQGAGANQWEAGRTWFKIYSTVGGTNCSSADPSAPPYTCFTGVFQPASISSDGLTLTWNQATCLNLGVPFTCPDEAGKANTGNTTLHGQGGVNYVVGENGDGITNLNFAHNTISNVPVNGGIGCLAVPRTGTGPCNIQNNIWWTSEGATSPARIYLPAVNLPALPAKPTICTGVGTPVVKASCPSGSGNLNGTYNWLVTVSANGLYGQGNETDGWPHPGTASPVNQQVSVNWNNGNFPYVNVYRTKAGGSTYWLIAHVANVITSCRNAACLTYGWVDNVSDSSLTATPCGATPVPPCQKSPPATNTTHGLGAHDYNSILNTAYAPGVVGGPHDFQYNSGVADPFVNAAGGDFHLVTTPTTDAQGNLYLLGTANGNPRGAAADFDGKTRGGSNGWFRGALQSGQGRPTPPTNLVIESVR
jgi:hypothetical protein